jgi:hypothetical protein
LPCGAASATDAAVEFGQTMTNVTASTGREAVFTCVVRDGNAYKASVRLFFNRSPVAKSNQPHVT